MLALGFVCCVMLFVYWMYPIQKQKTAVDVSSHYAQSVRVNIGELFISALGLAMIAALVPQHLMGFILGMWFLTQAAAFLLGGYVATFTAVPDNITDPLETLPVYTNVFGKIGLVTLGVAVVMLLMVPWLKRMIATPESH